MASAPTKKTVTFRVEPELKKAFIEATMPTTKLPLKYCAKPCAAMFK